MSPTLKSGQLLLVDISSVPKVGDILVFTNPDGEQYVHRWIKKENEQLITRGDNNRVNDDFTINLKDVLGIVVAIKTSKGVKKVTGGLQGRIIGAYRKFIRCYRSLYVRPIIVCMHFLPIKILLSIVGNFILLKRITLIKGSNNRIKIYFKKIPLGSYDTDKKDFHIRPVAQPFFSDTLYSILKQRIESK